MVLQSEAVANYFASDAAADEQGVEDAFELLHEVAERVRTGAWVGDCFIYNNSAWRLNYCVGGEVRPGYPRHIWKPRAEWDPLRVLEPCRDWNGASQGLGGSFSGKEAGLYAGDGHVPCVHVSA